MKLRFAFECYADEDVFYFLKDERNLSIERFHGFGQGEVVNELVLRWRADVGMVDEDPSSSHHGKRDIKQVVSESNDVQLRRWKDRHLIVVKPDLERCFLRSMERLDLEPTLGQRPQDLRARLNLPKHKAHQEFRADLSSLYQISRDRNVPSFITELEDIIRKLCE